MRKPKPLKLPYNYKYIRSIIYSYINLGYTIGSYNLKQLDINA